MAQEQSSEEHATTPLWPTSPKKRHREEKPCLETSWQILEKLKAICEEYSAAYISVLAAGEVQTCFAGRV